MLFLKQQGNPEGRAAGKLCRTFLGLVLCSGVCVAHASGLRVKADNVNLRSASGMAGEVVGQASSGDVLQALGPVDGDWVQVVPPSDCDLWVYGELVQDGKAAAPDVLVRAGAGINYKSVGRLQLGDRVTVRGSRGDWLRIAPPKGSSLWVNMTYCAPVAPAIRAVPSRPTVANQPPPVVQPSPPRERVIHSVPGRVAPPVAPVVREHVTVSDEDDGFPDGPAGGAIPAHLVAGYPQGKSVEYTGVLERAWWVWRRPGKYWLLTRDSAGRPVAACYVIASDSRMQGLVGQRVQVTGTAYWIQGVQRPALLAEAVQRVD